MTSLLTHPVVVDTANEGYRQKRIAYWRTEAQGRDQTRGFRGAYHRRIRRIYRHLVPPESQVLELGCGQGDLLGSLRSQVAVGVDFCPEMIHQAQKRHPQLRLIEADVHNLDLDETFDYIILSDLVNDLWDVQAVLGQVRQLAGPHTRILMNFHSRLWQWPLTISRKLGLANPLLSQNWLTVEDVTNLLQLEGFELIRRQSEILWPVSTPLIDWLCNRFLVKFWPFRMASFTNILIARPQPQSHVVKTEPTVSIIVPARNEAGNIAKIIHRTPQMGSGTELVFVEGHSTDNTYNEIEQQITSCPQQDIKLFQQTGTGKGDAVRLGFSKAKGDILMILDADMTVPPEMLPRFFDALRSGHGEFVNGVRLVYPMEDQAMRYLNLAGNKLFSLAFTWLIGQPIKDTLCGTKVMWRQGYRRIAANRSYFGEFDPFGDFDLLFGAARLSMKIVDLPVRYRERSYGQTNIRRWRHGLLLMRMTAIAARQLKFI